MIGTAHEGDEMTQKEGLRRFKKLECFLRGAESRIEKLWERRSIIAKFGFSMTSRLEIGIIWQEKIVAERW
jgi:hypothetical protein